MEFYAHIRPEAPEKRQALTDHCRNAAMYARAALGEAGLSAAAYLVALLHDMGKFKEEYQAYLLEAAKGGSPRRGSVNHTFAGVRFLLERYHDAEAWGDYAPLAAEILAYAVGAHHGQFDCVDPHHRSGFSHRLEKEAIGYEEARANFLHHCATEEELDQLFRQAVVEVEQAFGRFLSQLETLPTQEESLFYLGLLARLLLSAAEEGDRRDTAEFMNRKVFPEETTLTQRKQQWSRLLCRVEQQLEKLPDETPVQKARQSISEQCGRFGRRQGGIFRLNVPTGGGKTLSSLRFALAHGAERGNSRILFISPLLAILEQNAKEIRNYIQNDELILEHHSNVVRSEKDSEQLDRMELLMTTWDAPIILTTLVQFLNTLFDGKGGSIRRFHALCGSIIVLDEVQTVPSKLLSLFHLAVGFLAGFCGATVVLCSATQPCAQAAEHPIPLKTEQMVPYDPKLWKVFERTRIQNAGVKRPEELPLIAEEALAHADSLLVICNKKAQAERLYSDLGDRYLKFHLSAAMCMAHRSAVLEELKKALRDAPPSGKKVVCVSTQVMEAGVDISFGSVIRLTAGMDSVVQSAGRCNRNGERDGLAEVQIVTYAGEDLSHLEDIRRAKAATQRLLEEFEHTPEAFDGALTSDRAIEYYYRTLYEKEMPQGLQSGPVKADEHQTSLLDLLTENRCFCDAAFSSDHQRFILRQAFQTAGALFQVFDGKELDVLVPYGRGRELIAELGGAEVKHNYDRLEKLLEEAKQYTVSLYEWQKRKLEQDGALVSLCGGAVTALQEGYYDANVGLKMEAGTTEFLGV